MNVSLAQSASWPNELLMYSVCIGLVLIMFSIAIATSLSTEPVQVATKCAYAHIECVSIDINCICLTF